MKILKQERKENIMSMEIEVEWALVDKATNPAFQKVIEKVKLPGFRPGKVPRSVFEKQFGKEMILEEAANQVINKLYPEVIKTGDLQVIDYPKDFKLVTLTEGQPLVFTFNVEVKPEVKLGKYKGIKITKELYAVDDAVVTEAIDQVRERHAEYQEVPPDTTVEIGSLISFNVSALKEGNAYKPWSRERAGAQVGKSFIDPLFDAQLIGMRIGSSKDFQISFPADHKNIEVAGTSVSFYVQLFAIHNRVLPELTDELVKKASSFKTVEEFKQDIRTNLISDAEEDTVNAFHNTLVKEVAALCDTDIPDILVHEELDRTISNLEVSIKRNGLDFDQYLGMLQKTREDLRNEYRPICQERVKSTLVLEAIAEKEKLEVVEEDFEKEIARESEQSKKSKDEVARKYSAVVRERIKPYLLERKTIEWLADQAKVIEKKTPYQPKR